MINQTGLNPKTDAKKTTTEDPKELKLQETALKEQSKQLDKIKDLKKDVDKKLKSIFSTSLRSIAYTIINAVEDPPIELYNQIRPLLNKLQIAVLMDPNQTEIVKGQTNAKKESLYKLVLRRKSQLSPQHIERLKRDIEHFQAMDWNNKGLCMYLWFPYKPTTEVTPETPQKIGR